MRRAVVGFALVAILLLAPRAGASSYDPIASGTTTLTFSPSFSKFLAAHHVRIEPKAGAKRKGRKIVLAATGGEIDPVAGTASVNHAGTVVFASGRREIPFRAIVFKAKRTPLYAKLGGGQLKVARAKRLRFKRDGFGGAFEATGLRLSAKVATRLDKKLRLGRELKPGMEIGSVAVSVQPRTVQLHPTGRAYLAIAPDFAAKLDKLFVSLNPIAPAELGAGPTVSFPIGLESTLAPDGGSGTVKLGGSLEFLELGSAQLFWQEPWLDFAARKWSVESDLVSSLPSSGKKARDGVASLGEPAVSSDPRSRTISISAPLVLDLPTAQLLNEAFAEGRPEFAAGETIASLGLSAQGH